MAPDGGDSEQSSSNKVFTCCKTKLSACVVCVYCGNIFHKSCLQRRSFAVIDDTRIKCCSLPEPSSGECGDGKDLDMVVQLDKLSSENLFLKKIVEKTENEYKLIENNNKLLAENKKLLEDKIIQLQKELDKFVKKHNDKNSADKDKNKVLKQNQNKSFSMPASSGGHQRAVKINEGNLKTSTDDSTLQKSYKDIAEAQASKMMDIINLAQPTRSNPGSTLSIPDEYDGGGSNCSGDEGFTTVHYRKKGKYLKKRKQQKKNFGLDENASFGIERKAWIYLYRVRRDVTAEKIENFIKGQPIFQNSELVVKELPTNESQGKCFMFGADFRLKDELYKPSTWPKDIAYKRFDFKKYHNYQRNQKDF